VQGVAGATGEFDFTASLLVASSRAFSLQLVPEAEEDPPPAVELEFERCSSGVGVWSCCLRIFSGCSIWGGRSSSPCVACSFS
jgi:hypothetical protein